LSSRATTSLHVSGVVHHSKLAGLKLLTSPSFAGSFGIDVVAAWAMRDRLERRRLIGSS
jgi:hypothetical protein